jgi:hypothetical protein
MGSKSEEVKNCFSAFGLSLNADEIKKKKQAGCSGFTARISDTQEKEIREVVA